MVPIQVFAGFTDRERHLIDLAMRTVEERLRLEVSVYVGPSQGRPRSFAVRLHNALLLPSRSILITVDPYRRHVEIVLGSATAERIREAAAAHAATAMSLEFKSSRFSRGITRGLYALLHPDTDR